MKTIKSVLSQIRYNLSITPKKVIFGVVAIELLFWAIIVGMVFGIFKLLS